MQTRKQPITLRIASATLIALLSVMSLTSCTDQQIADSFAVAESALTATSAILLPVNPGIAEALGVGGKLVADANSAYLAYESAPASEKATAAGKVQAAIAAAQGNLSALLADVRVKSPEAVGYITAYIAVANTVLTLIVNHLPKASGTVAVASARVVGGSELPLVAGAKSAADLKKYFNSQVTALGHAEAVIR